MQVKYVNVSKSFGNLQILKDFNLTVKDGEFLVLLGPSGCGKTTALRMLAGLEDPTSGEIYIGNQMVNDVEPKDRDVAMVFQSYALYPHMTVYENISYPLKIRKIPAGEMRRLVEDVAQKLQIEHLLHRKPRELSGGQRQRVALGRALIRKPNVFLMDEPLSNLDAKLRVQMRGELKRLHSELGITIIYVTHDQVEAMTMADRIAVMNGGCLQQLDSPDEVYNNPANRFVGGFIGSPAMNFIPGRINRSRGQLEFTSFRYNLDAEWQGILEKELSDDELLLGIRPEDVEVHLTPVEGGVEGTVYVVEPTGKESILIVKVGDITVVADVEPDTRVEMNQKIWLTFKEQKMHIFDGKTEKMVV
jgi:multiple sugar transport system ATP-binding protein